MNIISFNKGQGQGQDQEEEGDEGQFDSYYESGVGQAGSKMENNSNPFVASRAPGAYPNAGATSGNPIWRQRQQMVAYPVPGGEQGLGQGSGQQRQGESSLFPAYSAGHGTSGNNGSTWGANGGGGGNCYNKFAKYALLEGVEHPEAERPRRPPPPPRYECRACQVSYESEQELDGHLSSVRHMRAVQGKPVDGGGGGQVGAGGNWTQQTRSRTTASHHEGLRKMLQESEVPTAGLMHVEEIVPETNADSYEPGYVCNLCSVTALAAGAFTHLTGHKHRVAFFTAANGGNKVDKKEALRRAKEMEEREGRDVSVITTILSDEKYPWPEGHQPWLQKNADGNHQKNKASAVSQGSDQPLPPPPVAETPAAKNPPLPIEPTPMEICSTGSSPRETAPANTQGPEPATSSKATNLGVAALLTHARKAPPQPPPQFKQVPPAKKRSKVSFKVRSNDVVTADSLHPLEDAPAYNQNMPGKKLGKGQRKMQQQQQQQQQAMEDLEAWNDEFQAWQQKSHPTEHADRWAEDAQGFDEVQSSAKGRQNQRRQKGGQNNWGSPWEAQEDHGGGWQGRNPNAKGQQKRGAEVRGSGGLRESVMNAPLSKSKAGVILPELCKCKIESNEDAAIAFDAVTALIKSLANYKASTVLPRREKEIHDFVDNLLTSLTSIMSIPSAEEEKRHGREKLPAGRAPGGQHQQQVQQQPRRKDGQEWQQQQQQRQQQPQQRQKRRQAPLEDLQQTPPEYNRPSKPDRRLRDKSEPQQQAQLSWQEGRREDDFGSPPRPSPFSSRPSEQPFSDPPRRPTQRDSPERQQEPIVWPKVSLGGNLDIDQAFKASAEKWRMDQLDTQPGMNEEADAQLFEAQKSAMRALAAKHLENAFRPLASPTTAQSSDAGASFGGFGNFDSGGADQSNFAGSSGGYC